MELRNPSGQVRRGAGIIENIVGMGEPLLATCLGRDDRLHLLGLEATALHHPGDLLRGRTVDDQDPIDPLQPFPLSTSSGTTTIR